MALHVSDTFLAPTTPQGTEVFLAGMCLDRQYLISGLDAGYFALLVFSLGLVA